MTDMEKLRDAALIASKVLHQLKSLTKQIPAATWTPEYRALAEIIHSGTREFEAALWDGDRRLI